MIYMNYYLIKYKKYIYVFEAPSAMTLVSKIAKLKLQDEDKNIEYYGKIKNCFIAHQVEYECSPSSIKESARLKYLYFSITYNEDKLGYVYVYGKQLQEDYDFIENQRSYKFEERMFFNIENGPKTKVQIYVEDKFSKYNIEVVQPLKITINEFLHYYKDQSIVDTIYNSVCTSKIKQALINQVKKDKENYMTYFNKIIKCAEERNFNEN